MFGNLSVVHVLLLLIVIAMIFGTSKLKNLGKDLGGAINGFKEAMREGEQQAQVTANKPESLLHNPPVSPQTPAQTQAVPSDQHQSV